MEIIKEDVGYGAYTKIGNTSIITMGETFDELQDMIIDAVNLAFEEEGIVYSIEEIKFKLDLDSFFKFYKVINVKALSQRIGMHQSLLAQYISGTKKPSPAQTKKIMHGVQKLGRELADIEFLI